MLLLSLVRKQFLHKKKIDNFLQVSFLGYLAGASIPFKVSMLEENRQQSMSVNYQLLDVWPYLIVSTRSSFSLYDICLKISYYIKFKHSFVMFENDYNYMLIYTYIFYVKKYYNSSTIKIYQWKTRFLSNLYNSYKISNYTSYYNVKIK